MSQGYITVSFQMDPVTDPMTGSNIISATIIFSDFDINMSDLKINHSAFLDAYTAWLATAPGVWFGVDGFASLTGPADWDYTLSKNRASNVAAGLTSRGATKDQVRFVGGLGAQDLAKDGTLESYQSRAVVITVNVSPDQADTLTAFQTAWNSSQLQHQAAPPSASILPGETIEL